MRNRNSPAEISRISKILRDMKERDGNSTREAAGRLGISLTTAERYCRAHRLDPSAPVTAKEMRAQKRREVGKWRSLDSILKR